jgi:hypothetical protein
LKFRATSHILPDRSSNSAQPIIPISMKKSIKLIVGAGIAGVLVFSGTSCTPTQRGAAIGSGIGAGTGAIIGNQSGNAGRGALIGAAAGGLGGALIGDASDNRRRY